MKKFKPSKIVLGLIALGFLGILVFLFRQTYGGVPGITEPDPVRTASRDRITISQAYLSGMAGRVKDRNNEIYYYLTPKINLRAMDDIDSEVKKVEINNISLSNYPAGAAVKFLAPGHINPYEDQTDPYFNKKMQDFDYNFDNFASLHSIEYGVVQGSYTKYPDDFAASGDFLEFLVLVYKAGNFDEATIINREGIIDSSKYLQYAGISADSINGELSFIVQMTFENGEQAYYKFVFQIKGDDMVNTGFINYDPKLDGKTF